MGAAAAPVEVSLARAHGSGRGGARVLLPEIQALRALAVAAVLVFHLVPSRFPGGFIGVDIFFVISGFLITGHLLREIDRSGRIDVARFWARRAKRLLPAALVTLAVVSLATFALVPRVLWGKFFGETLAATFYVQNWRLAADSVDYFAAAGHPSPVQHFWTLSVEEQFYVALPLLLLGGLALHRWSRVPVRALLLGLLGGVVAVSLVVSVLHSASNPAVAYFSSFTRAWEFAVGGLLAFLPVTGRLAGSLAIRTGVAGAGCLAIGAALATFDERTVFPGHAALLPVLGTVAVIWGGTLPWRCSPSGIGAWSPVATVGRVSYAIYLWHWPLVVLLPVATGSKLRLADMVVVSVGSLVLALVTTRWVEDPVRFSPRLLGGARRPRTVALWSIAGMVVVGAVAGIGLAATGSAVAEASAARDRAWAADVACLGAAALEGRPESCAAAGLGGVLVPHPVFAPQDRLPGQGCWSGNGESALHMCTLGPSEGYSRRVLALGDSHSNMLVPAYEVAAHELGWRIDVAGHANCYWTRATTPDPVPAHAEACTAWREAVDEHLRDAAPYDAIVVVASRTAELARPVGAEDGVAATVRGLHEAWESQRARGTLVVAIADVPQPRRDVVECVVRHGAGAVERCGTPRDAADRPEDLAVRAALVGEFPLVDLTDLMCDAEQCHAVVEDAVVWQDRGHLTATFARSLGPALAARLAALVSSGEGPGR